MTTRHAVVVGNSDGIGLGLTKALLGLGWTVTGISRSPTSVNTSDYKHIVGRVQDGDYPGKLASVLEDMTTIDLCVYCAGIGELLDPESMDSESEIFEVNLLGLVRTCASVIPAMAKRGQGHFIGLSSVADAMLSAEAPSYHASKAGFTSYLEGLAIALKHRGVHVTNVRFGFVDTKMAKGDVKPFMMGVDQAVFHLLRCLDRKPMRYTAPRIVLPLVALRSAALSLRVLAG